MKHLFKQKIHFLIPYLLFLFAGGILLSVKSKSQIHLFLNQFHNPFADKFFKNLTYLGDGFTAMGILIVLLCIKYRFALIYSVSAIATALTAQVLKHIFDQIRPTLFFEGKSALYFVPDVDMNIYYSFPSGHTTSAFTIYFMLALFVKNKYLQTGLFTLALLVGYSRVYLSQHFFQDIYVGSIIGTTFSFVIFYFLNNSTWLTTKNWADKNLLNSVRKK